MPERFTPARASGRGPAADPRADIRASWLVRLRWGSFAGQVIVILGARYFFGIDLPYWMLLALAAALGVTNVWLSWRVRRGRPLSTMGCGGMLTLDTLQLTAILFLSGGTSNPFSVFYLVQITIAAVTLGSRWTWVLAVLGVSSYAALFLLPGDPNAEAAVHAAHRFSQHLQAMWIALTLSAGLTAYFVTRLTSIVAEQDVQIAAMRETASRHERLVALTTLAAGAAHELGTPLATVAIAAGELERAIAELPAAESELLASDVRLIRAELVRCREIIDGMGGDAGHAAGEMPTEFGQAELCSDLLARINGEDKSRVEIQAGAPAFTSFFLPRRAIGRAIFNLVRNALDASHTCAVRVEVEAGPRLRVRVSDTGPGMSAAVLAQAGEPFFTTKDAGHGLGLFVTRSLAAELGGRLTIDSRTGRGTDVTLDVPSRIGEYAAV